MVGKTDKKINKINNLSDDCDKPFVKPKHKEGNKGIRGGKQPGSGRPRGAKSQSTIDREKVLEMAKDIIAGRTRKLIDTQTILATGAIKIFKIHYHWEGSAKKRTLIKDKPQIVENDQEIIHVIDHEFGSGQMGNPNDHDYDDEEYDYFFVMTKDPDNQAINSLMDRTFGRATENKNHIISKGMGVLLDEIEKEE